MIEQNVPLRPFNTFGISVSAKMLAHITDPELLREVIMDPHLKKERKFVLGCGSNVLFTGDVDALVLKNEIGGMNLIAEDADAYYVRSGAGVIWQDLVEYCILNKYPGIENLSLIPGNVGAAPMQNIGAYGVELKDVFRSLEAMDLQTGEIQEFDAADCAFGYRESVFKKELKDRSVITSVTLRLLKNAPLNTSYGAIEQELERLGIGSPTIADVSRAVINIRQRKLPDPTKLGNAGSFFKNPVVDRFKFDDLRSEFPQIPGYHSDEKVKLAAGWLIEQCGWKGRVVGNTGCHAYQALVLVNHGNASGAEILELSERIARSVSDRFGVQLEREVNVY